MGNSIQAKKKVQTEENSPVRSSSSPQRVKSKGSWLFGRRDKVKTGKRRTTRRTTLDTFSAEGNRNLCWWILLIQLLYASLHIVFAWTGLPRNVHLRQFHPRVSFWTALWLHVLWPAVWSVSQGSLSLLKVPAATKSTRQTGLTQTQTDSPIISLWVLTVSLSQASPHAQMTFSSVHRFYFHVDRKLIGTSSSP